MRKFMVLMFLFFVCGCAGLPERRLSDVRQPSPSDPAVLETDVLGITVGMTPRRVLTEFNKNSWELGKLSEMTLEDMIESRQERGVFYLNTVRPRTGNLEIHFNRGKVIFARHTYEISEEALVSSLEQAKQHLTQLGGFTEDIDSMGHKLTYKKFNNAYVFYDFHKLVKEQRGYRVWFVVCMY